tara:strand:- start:1231 stop:1431 length:201 start_codon:yes stop_codon:yes gene_type:complete
LAGVDEHGSAPFYFKLLMKRTKKDALKAMQNLGTPTNEYKRPRIESQESIASSVEMGSAAFKNDGS